MKAIRPASICGDRRIAAAPAFPMVDMTKNVTTRPAKPAPRVRRPDGHRLSPPARFPTGQSTAHTAIWTPPAKGKKGTWTAGPDFPNGDSRTTRPCRSFRTEMWLVEGANSGELYESMARS